MDGLCHDKISGLLALCSVPCYLLIHLCSVKMFFVLENLGFIHNLHSGAYLCEYVLIFKIL